MSDDYITTSAELKKLYYTYSMVEFTKSGGEVVTSSLLTEGS